MSLEAPMQEAICPNCGKVGTWHKDLDDMDEHNGMYKVVFDHGDEKHVMRRGGSLFGILMSGRKSQRVYSRRKGSPKMNCMECGKESPIIHCNAAPGRKERLFLQCNPRGHDKYHCVKVKYFEQISVVYNKWIHP